MFLTYSEYVSMGGELDQEEFTPLEYRALSDIKTHGLCRMMAQTVCFAD